MSEKNADYVYHPPSGSSLPGSPDANPYIFYPPEDLRKLIKSEKDETKLIMMRRALKQWERIYVFPGYPWRRVEATTKILRSIAAMLFRMAEVTGPHPRNMPYYNDVEVPEGYESVMHGLRGLYDNDNRVRFDIPRQGERPKVDIDTSKGDFLTPKQDVFDDATKTKGDGADPEGMETVEPPTGGNLDPWPDAI